MLEEFLVFLVSLLVHTHKSVKFIHYFGFHLIRVTEKIKTKCNGGHSNGNATFILRAALPNKFRTSRILLVSHSNNIDLTSCLNLRKQCYLQSSRCKTSKQNQSLCFLVTWRDFWAFNGRKMQACSSFSAKKRNFFDKDYV